MSIQQVKVNEPIANGSAVRVTIAAMDAAGVQADAAAGGRDAAHALMTDRIRNAWQDSDAATSSVGDRRAAMSASIAAAEATGKRVADARADGETAHAAMVARLNDAWKSS
jgi:hypothetical protein